jgi:uncharacterized membrane protein
MEDLLAVLHVVGAVFIIGPMAILPMTAMRSVRAGQGAQVAVLAKSTFVFALLSLVVAVLGFGILGVADKSEDDTTVSTPWVLISIILYVLAVGLTLLAVVPALRSAAEHLQNPASQELSKPDYRRISIGSGVTTLLLVAVVVLMTWKPGG